MNQAERRDFVREHRTAVFGNGRRQTSDINEKLLHDLGATLPW